jgi:hypothetical protein
LREHEKVVVGYCTGGQWEADFGEALVDLVFYDETANRRLRDGGGVLGWKSGVNVSGARNEICRRFLEHSRVLRGRIGVIRERIPRAEHDVAQLGQWDEILDEGRAILGPLAEADRRHLRE